MSKIIHNIFSQQFVKKTKEVQSFNETVLLGVSSKNVARVQRVLNAAGWVVIWGSRQRSTNSPVLLNLLHWLPIEWRIKFKITCITYKTDLLASLLSSIHC